MNHVTTESVAEASNVLLGMFHVNSFLATVLFDTGASHAFISKSFVESHHISTHPTQNPMLVTSPGGNLQTTRCCPKVSLEIRG